MGALGQFAGIDLAVWRKAISFIPQSSGITTEESNVALVLSTVLSVSIHVLQLAEATVGVLVTS
jgi:hypothetical protein